MACEDSSSSSGIGVTLNPPNTDTGVLPNLQDPQNPLIMVNMTNITKLTLANYITWTVQIRKLLSGYNLYKFVAADYTAPPEFVTVDSVSQPNPAYTTWLRQDNLLFSALLGAISIPLQPLIATAATCKEAWNILANTYGKASRGHIKQLKDNLKRSVKGSQSIDVSMQSIKTKVDGLALLEKPIDHEDLLEIILAGLGEDYKPVADAVNARETAISFDELHEKLVNREADLLSVAATAPTSFPITANPASHRSSPSWRSDSRQGDRKYTPDSKKSNFYMGRCQASGIQGHSVKRCPSFRIVAIHSQPSDSSPLHRTSAPWQPSANPTALSTSAAWLLDSGASHHITTDLSNLALHTPYNGSDGVVIGNGSGLKISHTGEGSQLGGAIDNRKN